MTGSLLRDATLQLFSTLVAGVLLLSVLSAMAGSLEQRHLVLVVLTIPPALVLRYAAVYHRFENRGNRAIAVAASGVSLLLLIAYLLESIRPDALSEGVQYVFRVHPFRFGAHLAPPEGWFAGLLVVAGSAILVGAATTWSLAPYPKPTRIHDLAASPAYFGLVCAVFGVWAVLLVGLPLQRVIVIAPFFEELLKFGVAILVGSVLFDRSLLARIGVAIVVGSTFGYVEHLTTYPTEDHLTFLLRVVFHAATTILSVSFYTTFASLDEEGLQWIAPAYSILLHFFYNTFVVVSSLVGLVLLGTPSVTVANVYGFAAVLVATGLLVVGQVHRGLLVAIHRPLEHVLSDVA